MILAVDQAPARAICNPMYPKVSIGCVLPALLLTSGSVVAQHPAPPDVDLAAFAARRFPQPVRVGDLINRTVLQPLESRPVLGRVAQVIRLNNGKEEIVMRHGGFLGFGGRYIAVPIEAMALLGNELEVLDYTPQQLNAFPTYTGAGTAPLAAADVIRMGLARPSH
jgi:hypothetical protein